MISNLYYPNATVTTSIFDLQTPSEEGVRSPLQSLATKDTH